MNLQMEINSLKQRIAELEQQAEQKKEFTQEGDSFYSISETGNIEGGMIWGGYPVDMNRMAIGNVFKTEDEAEFAVEKLKVESELLKFSKPFKNGQPNCNIILSDNENVSTAYWKEIQTQGSIYFESEEKAQQAIESVGEERIKKYIFGVED